MRPSDPSSQPPGLSLAQPFWARSRYGPVLAVVALAVIVVVLINVLIAPPRGKVGILAGEHLPPFAVPLVTGNVRGEANIATHANEGSAGRRPACTVRGPGILNVCQLYQRGPLVLALFLQAGGCPAILQQLQALAPSFPGVQFAAVAIAGDRSQLRHLVVSHGLSLPVGIDSGDAAVAQLYRVFGCPQVTFAYPGGIAQGKPLLAQPSRAALRARIAQLVAASRARGWRQPQ
jgi:hypothetical protein